MRYLRTTGLLSLWLLATTALADIPQGLKLAGQGDGLYKGLIKVYRAELTSSPQAKRATILNPEVSRCLKLQYAVDLSADKFILAANTVLQRQQDAQTLQHLQPQLEQLHSSYQNVKAGDVYRLCYNAANQTLLLQLNDKTLTRLQAPELASAYFGIWLSEHKPLAQRLQEDLLQHL